MAVVLTRLKIRYHYRWQLITPALVTLLFVNGIPILHAAYTSIQFYYLSRPQDRRFVGFENYIQALTDSAVLHSLKVTFVFSISAVLLELILGFILAYLLVIIPKFSNIFLAVLIIPMMLNQVAVGLIWRLLLHPDLGIINFFIRSFGLPGPNWLGTSQNALLTLIFVDAWQWTPLVMLLIYAGLLSLPSEPFEAARIDGANRFQTLIYHTIPLMYPVILVAVIIRIMDALKTYSLVYILTGGGPGTATEVLSFHIYKIGFIFSNMGKAAALSFFLSLVIMVITIFFLQITRKSSARD